jgi:tRNA 2-selenouridine synthase
LPLFDDAERAVVGTAYKQQSRENAIKIGLDYFGPKMRSMIETVESLIGDKLEKTIYLHCWRGGMRSSAIAWLLSMYGFEVVLLEGGYKSYRNWVLERLRSSYNFKVIGGYTGSGKTNVLHQLESMGESVIDLEKLASHKGSSFGHIGLPDQPSQEMFENTLAHQLYYKSKSNNPIWIEDESQRIGHVELTKPLYTTIMQSPIYFLEIGFQARLTHIVKEYGNLDKSELESAIIRIQKKLGGLDVKNAIQFLQKGDISACFSILLNYYDKSYLRNLENKAIEFKHVICCENTDAETNAEKLIKF